MPNMTRKSFLHMCMGATAAAISNPALAQAATGVSAAPREPERILIKGADLLTMDPASETLVKGDVLIEGSKIVAVGPTLDVQDAQVIDATDCVLMPGMVDGHRHLFQDIFKNHAFEDYLVTGQLPAAVVFTPEDLYFAGHLGGMTAIDSGVTSVVDFCHAVRSAPQVEAAARGMIDSGVGGVFTPQLPARLTYAPGVRMSVEEAWQQNMGPADPAAVAALLSARDKLFTGADNRVQFGVALTAAEFARRTPEEARVDFQYAARLDPALIVQHVLGTHGDWKMGQPRAYRLIADYYKAGLLGPKYLAVHANGLTDDELKMLADSGSSITSTVIGETFYGRPPIHARAREAGVKVAIGIDGAYHRTHDYFTVVNAAKTSLCRTDRDMALARKMSPLDYLKLATIGGAEAIGQAAKIGSITPGKRADLVLIRTDRDFYPMLGSTAEKVFLYANITDIDRVWVGGKLHKQDGKLIDFDWRRVRAEAAQRTARIVSEARKIDLYGKLAASFPGKND